MDFSELLAEILQLSGIDVLPSSIPVRDVLQANLDNIQMWIESLEPDTVLALEEVTAEFPVKVGLASSEVSLAPDLAELLAAFDSLPLSLSISTILDQLNNAIAQVSA